MDEQRWQVTVDRNVCMGSGSCVGTSSGGFRLDAEGKSRPVAEFVEPDDTLIDAAELCPAEAITVRDATGRQLAPS